MVVDGAVVMVENIVRHMGRRDAEPTPVMTKIREAAHEVQRPVFYAIGIIITAYLPIFTLQAVEGRLFKPMAWKLERSEEHTSELQSHLNLLSRLLLQKKKHPGPMHPPRPLN